MMAELRRRLRRPAFRSGRVVATSGRRVVSPDPDRIYFQAATFNPGGKFRARAVSVIRSLSGRVTLLFLQEGGWLLRLGAGYRSSMRLLRPWRGTPVIVDTDRVSVVRVVARKLTGRRKIEKAAAGPTNADPRYLVKVLLRFKRGARLLACNWHGTPSIQFRLARAAHAEQVRKIAGDLKAAVRAGQHVVFAVDGNGEHGHPNFDPLRAAGLRFVASPVATHIKTGRVIDGFWVSKAVQVHHIVIEDGANPKDHRVVIVLFSIPATDRTAR